ncbi:uncharacterized protein LOC105233231 [Bactrocera dorsalis]|uniref:Uncharacterized protein LOC105233231 n=1 Tax=Bactrocera dorsalis TaxID=27457 RepID=A0A6I9W8Y4_BACDO|nr:uncharacterized protein LOC105233231 [Bactrocera dorsalis]
MSILAKNTQNRNLQSYKDFLAAVNAEEYFESCLFYGEPRNSEVLNLFLRAATEHFRKPVIMQTVNKTNQEISSRFNRDMLIVAQLTDFKTVLPTLATTLERMRQKRIILSSAERLTDETVETYLRQVFRYCEAEKLLNVVLIFDDFPETKLFYSYSIFPSFELEVKLFGTNGMAVFPRRMLDLQGYGIRTVPDQIFPWSFTYELDGQVKIGGYVQQLMEMYANYLNATLTYPIAVLLNDVAFAANIDELMASNQLDIPTSRKFIELAKNFDEASIPFGVSSLHIMAPIVRHHFFWSFLIIYGNWRHLIFWLLSYSSSVMLFCLCRHLQYMLVGRRSHRNFFAALLEPNYLSANFGVVHHLVTLRLIICVSAVCTLCLYTDFTAHLNTFLTKPAMVRNPRSWHDLDVDGHKVLFSKRYYAYVRMWCEEVCAQIERSLEIIDSPEKLRELQLGFNTSYAYPIDVFSWHLFKLQMRKLMQPIFRMTGICLKPNLFHCFHLQRNSIFKESLDLFLTRIVDHGLQEHLIYMTYLEAVRFGVIKSFSRGDHVLEQPLDMAYFSFMWPFFGFAWTLAFIIFAIELVSVRWRKWIPREKKR